MFTDDISGILDVFGNKALAYSIISSVPILVEQISSSILIYDTSNPKRYTDQHYCRL